MASRITGRLRSSPRPQLCDITRLVCNSASRSGGMAGLGKQAEAVLTP
jgi:hypothetical protein